MAAEDIFYSPVDKNLQIELNARGKAGFHSKTNSDLQFMLGKIAGVHIMAYTNDTKTQVIPFADLGGYNMRSGEFMPSGPNGYLQDRAITQFVRGINNTGTDITTDSTTIYNTSRRTPPFITSCEISTGDGSNGLLNTATVNITIPNPERDLNFIESVYFRPGRNCTIIIQHDSSSLIDYTRHNGLLTLDSSPTDDVLDKLYGLDKQDYLIKHGQLNSKRFDGIITSFTLQYESDMSVTSTIELRGGGTPLNELSIIVAENSTKTPEQLEQEKKIALDQVDAAVAETKANATGATNNPVYTNFYIQLNDKVKETLKVAKLAPKLNTNIGIVVANTIVSPGTQQQYISLKFLIEYVNTQIIDAKLNVGKTSTDKTFAKITLDDTICTSTYYDNLYSIDPQRVIIPTSKKYNPPGTKYKLGMNHLIYNKNNNPTVFEGDVLSWDSLKVIPISKIYINMDVIKEQFQALNRQSNFNIETFFERISDEVYEATAGAYNLKLITPPSPRHTEANKLLYYDTNIGIPNGPEVIPYSVPMFSNHPYGTVIREFSFNGKLPADASSLAYVTAVNPKNINEKDIAPFLSYMYNANTVDRGSGTESVGTMITKEQLIEIQKTYKTTHETIIKELDKATTIWFGDPNSVSLRATMANAMRKYLQYPKPSIEESNQMKAPIIPFEASFTIDGINGFKYGNVLKFSGLPKRYHENCVFLVVGLTDSVSTDGQWTTAVRCLMRPKIGA